MTYSYRYDLFLLTLRQDPYHERALSLSTALSKEVGGAAAPPTSHYYTILVMHSSPINV